MKIRTLVIEIGIKNIESLRKKLKLKNVEFIFASSFLDVVDTIYQSDIHIILLSDFRGIKSTTGYIKMFIKTNSNFKIIIISNQKSINRELKYKYIQYGASSFISCFDFETIKNNIYDIYIDIINNKENLKNWSNCTKKAIRFIKDNYSIHKGLINNMIKTIKYSESTIYHSIKKDTGISLGEWINNLRINGSVKLLKSTLLPVKTVSEKTGYNSIQGFIKAFKKATGKTPSELRNS